MRKILAIDLDQTLLRSDKTISEYTIETFRKLKENNGYGVFIATGRSIMRSQDYMCAIRADGIIALNGASTLYEEKMISKYNIAEEKAVALINNLLLIPETFVNVTYPDIILSNNKTLDNGDGVHRYTDYSEIDAREITKISLVTEYPQRVREIDFSFYDCRVHEVASDPKYFAISNCHVSKLRGLNDLCRYLNITLTEVIAFGDDYNDLDILSHSGYAVVVANAQEEIKSVADTICKPNDEDGVADWINENLL